MKNFNKANELYNSKDYINAITYYEKAIENDENKIASVYNKGVCYMKLKQYNKAIPYFKKAIRLKEDSKYYFNLGYSYAMIKDNKKALVNFNTAWALDNNDKDAEKAINLIIKSYQSDKHNESNINYIDKDEENTEIKETKSLIKGNINKRKEKIYHMPSGRDYNKVNAKFLFETEEEAIKKGFRKAKY